MNPHPRQFLANLLGSLHLGQWHGRKPLRIYIELRSMCANESFIERVPIRLPLATGVLSRAETWRKRVTVGESVRINKQLCWVAGLAEGQGGV